MNWSPRSMNAMPPVRPRSSSGPKIDSQNFSASPRSPTSSAMWLIPRSLGIASSVVARNFPGRDGVEASVVGRPLDEPDLIQRAKRGDTHAYEELVHAYQGIAFRTAYVIARNAADAEEA